MVAERAHLGLLTDESRPAVDPVSDHEEGRVRIPRPQQSDQPLGERARPVVEGECDRVRARTAAVDRPTETERLRDRPALLPLERHVRTPVGLGADPRGECEGHDGECGQDDESESGHLDSS